MNYSKNKTKYPFIHLDQIRTKRNHRATNNSRDLDQLKEKTANHHQPSQRVQQLLEKEKNEKNRRGNRKALRMYYRSM